MHKPALIIAIFVVFSLIALILYQNQQTQSLKKQQSVEKESIEQKLASVSAELKKLKETDQIKRNDELEAEIKNIETTYKDSVNAYESLLDLKAANPKTDKSLDVTLAETISLLSERNFSSASAKLKDLTAKIASEKSKYLTTLAPALAPAPISNSAPSSGYSRQTVHTDFGDFVVDLVAGDLGSTRVIVDTATDGDCKDNCPVLSLADYVSRNGAYAGINGTYFCPADYPSCAGKTNSFDLLVMNKNKKYINSDNNVYSTNPAAIFGNGYVRFVGAAQEWGRDTGVDGVISNFPLLVSGGNSVFAGTSDPKQGSKGTRSFVANKGNIVYIGVAHNVTVPENALVLKALGMDNAMNLDSGGSTALWSGGYKAGPGRSIPNAVLFIRK